MEGSWVTLRARCTRTKRDKGGIDKHECRWVVTTRQRSRCAAVGRGGGGGAAAAVKMRWGRKSRWVRPTKKKKRKMTRVDYVIIIDAGIDLFWYRGSETRMGPRFYRNTIGTPIWAKKLKKKSECDSCRAAGKRPFGEGLHSLRQRISSDFRWALWGRGALRYLWQYSRPELDFKCSRRRGRCRHCVFRVL